ncbi:MAG: helix-turn-helix transcriptional regulator [Selenomonadaceae bacterium]|nr:helix-turn-helix transcriptional regulator [Selenomonadaceae bacterium]
MLSENLKKARNDRHLSQRALADIIGVSQQTVGSWEVGRTSPDNEMLKKLASFFNVSVDYLLGRTGEPHTIAKGSSSTDLTPKEEREIEHDLEDMINSMASAAYESDNGEQEDIEALQATLRAAMIQAKRIAKKKYTPRKYRKD